MEVLEQDETVVYVAIMNREPEVGNKLQCKREVSNVKDRYAIAVVKDKIVVQW